MCLCVCACMFECLCIHAHMLINMRLPCPQTPQAGERTLRQNTQQGQTQLIPRQCQQLKGKIICHHSQIALNVYIYYCRALIDRRAPREIPRVCNTRLSHLQITLHKASRTCGPGLSERGRNICFWSSILSSRTLIWLCHVEQEAALLKKFHIYLVKITT